MFGFIDVLPHKLQIFLVGLLVVGNVLLLLVLFPELQLHHVHLTPLLSGAASASPVTGSSDTGSNAVTNGFAAAGRSLQGTLDSTGQRLGRLASLPATVFSKSGRFITHGAYVGVISVGRGISDEVGWTARSVGHGTMFVLRVPGKIAGFVVHPSHWRNIITPADHTPVPTITQLRAQQAAIIESGTKDVSILALASGSGGACDDGQGNGGYPQAWCNAPMDSLRTVGYSGEAINRECTSYAYWYFTNIEGHTDFRATGDAKYWATTSNYPIHAAPAVGSIAVETAGAYGHVAIVQALPGQHYGGQVVPAGYVLVSEMNYDWGGHFRYSFSPLGKFAAYIY